MNPLSYLAVFVGAGIGGILRHAVNSFIVGMTTTAMPIGIMAINISGSFLLGLFSGYFSFKGDDSGTWRLFLTTGLCGGYTTFSTFSQDTVLLIERGQPGMALLYAGLSVSMAIFGFFAGLWIMRQLS